LYDVTTICEDNAATFIENNLVFLPLFLTELYERIQHFTNNILPYGDNDYDLAYGHPQYVKIASLLATKIPTIFCAFVNDWYNADKLKQALYFTSKQHNFPQRAACLTILSTFGDLTIELCEMMMNALYDDPYNQNTCYKCLFRIKSIKDEKIVLNQLFEYLKSKSMNIRYVSVKILLHLCRCSLISLKEIEVKLNDVINDPSSSEGLWLIQVQEELFQYSVYLYAGRLKDVVYTLFIQHLMNDTSELARRNELNEIDSDFFDAEKAARHASCLYESKIVRATT